MKKSDYKIKGILMIIPVLMLLLPATSQAATKMVNSLLDDGDGTCTETKCTFRDAINTALEGDIVEFENGLAGTIDVLSPNINIDKNLDIIGPGSDVIALDFSLGSASLRHLGGDVSVSGLRLTGGNPAIYARAEYEDTLTIENVLFEENEDDSALYNDLRGSVVINNSKFINNTGYDYTTAIYHYDGNLTINNSYFDDDSDGGAYSTVYVEHGVLSINDSTFANNTLNNAYGGAILVEDAVGIITNSTFYNNSNLNGGWGGAIYSESPDLTIVNSTFYQNEATEGADIYNKGGVLKIVNSILASSNVDSCAGDSVVSLGNNIDIGSSCGFSEATDLLDTDPLLDTDGAKDNGGNVKTIALLEESPAIDAADDTQAPDTDARGVSRPQGSASDIGAYEKEQTVAVSKKEQKLLDRKAKIESKIEAVKERFENRRSKPRNQTEERQDLLNKQESQLLENLYSILDKINSKLEAL